MGLRQSGVAVCSELCRSTLPRSCGQYHCSDARCTLQRNADYHQAAASVRDAGPKSLRRGSEQASPNLAGCLPPTVAWSVRNVEVIKSRPQDKGLGKLEGEAIEVQRKASAWRESRPTRPATSRCTSIAAPVSDPRQPHACRRSRRNVLLISFPLNAGGHSLRGTGDERPEGQRPKHPGGPGTAPRAASNRSFTLPAMPLQLPAAIGGACSARSQSSSGDPRGEPLSCQS